MNAEPRLKLFVREPVFYKRFFTMTLLIASQNLIVFGVNLADNVMLGRYSEVSLSGAALVNQYQFLLQMLVMGVGEGAGVLMARYWGQRDLGAIRRMAGTAMRVSLLLQLAMWAFVFFFTRPALALMIDDAAVLDEGVRYMRIVCFSYPLFTVTNILNITLRSVETTFLGFAVSLLALVVNITLNYMLIFGHWGVPRMGAEGAALATLLARVAECAVVVGYIFLKERKLRLRPRDFVKPDAASFRLYLKIGSPVLVSNALWGVAMMAQTMILGRLGATAVVANSVATTMFQVVSVLIYGMAGPAGVMTGKAIGEGRRHMVRQYAVTFQALFVIMGAVSGLAMFLCRSLVVDLFGLSADSRALAMRFVTVLSVTIVGTAYQVPCLTGIVRGGGDTRFVMKNDIVFMWLIVLPASAAAAFWLKLPPLVVFACLKSDQITKCLVAAVKVNRFRWIKTWGGDAPAEG